MINIAFCITRLRRSGPVKVMESIIKYLNINCYSVTIITLKTEINNDSMLENFIEMKCKVICMQDLHNRSLQTVINENKIQIVHCHCLLSLILVSRLVDCYKIFTLHQISKNNYISSKGLLVGLIMCYLESLALPKCDKIIACSRTVYNNYKQKYLNLEVVLNGHDISSRLLNSIKSVTRQELCIPKDARVFIALGSLDKRKNSLNLAKMFLKASGPKDYLLFVGNGPLYCNIKKLDSNRVILTGFQRDVVKYVGASDYYISASKAEGLPLSVIEALAVGVPVILSDISSHCEFFELNDDIGLIFKINNLPKIFSRLSKMDYFDMHKNCLKLYESSFTAKLMSEKYMIVYQKAVG